MSGTSWQSRSKCSAAIPKSQPLEKSTGRSLEGETVSAREVTLSLRLGENAQGWPVDKGNRRSAVDSESTHTGSARNDNVEE